MNSTHAPRETSKSVASESTAQSSRRKSKAKPRAAKGSARAVYLEHLAMWNDFVERAEKLLDEIDEAPEGVVDPRYVSEILDGLSQAVDNLYFAHPRKSR